MKKFFAVLALLLLMAAPSFALSDADYLKMKKNNQSFARADRKLTNTWNKLKKSLPEFVFKELQKDQRDWVGKGRDDDAKQYLKEGYSRVEAYTMATNDRANALPQIAQSLMNNAEGYEPPEEPVRKPRPTQRPRPAPKREEPEEPDEPEEPGFPLDEDDDNKGEIEEDRFKGSTGPEGNYSRRNSGNKGGFMTVLITNKEENEAEVTISVLNPEVTWSAKGWINDDNVLELFDTNYSGCQLNLTFSNGRVKVESSPDDDWDEVLGEGVRLDGVYDKN